MILEFVNNVIHNFNTNFDISFIISVNVLTYLAIRIIDTFNGSKSISVWNKRLIAIISSIVLAILYSNIGYDNLITLINSTIIAPVSWSWIFKPIVKLLRIDYKQIIESKKL